MPEPTIAASVATALLGLAATKGASLTALGTLAEIDEAALQDPDGRITLASYARMMRAAKRLTGDAALALHFGEEFDLAEISVLGVVAAPNDRVADGVTLLNRYAPLAVEAQPVGRARFDLVYRDGAPWLVDQRPDPDGFPELTESTFARIASATRRMGVELIREVHVSHADPGYPEEYERILGVPVTFGTPWNALQLDEDLLRGRAVQGRGYVHSAMTRHADKLLERLDRDRSARGKVEQVLVEVLPAGRATLGAVLPRLGTSRQTLYRHLKAEGTSFEGVLTQLRRELALKLLGAGGVSTAEVAHRLGFSDRASFSKAFKRWTGIGPGEARRSSSPRSPAE